MSVIQRHRCEYFIIPGNKSLYCSRGHMEQKENHIVMGMKIQHSTCDFSNWPPLKNK